MGFSFVKLGFVFVMMMQVFSWSVMANECDSRLMEKYCSDDKQYFCSHHCSCFGYDEYCSVNEDKIQSCLPQINALEWCKANSLNKSAWYSPQCREACSYRFNNTSFGDNPVQDETGSIQTKRILIAGYVLFAISFCCNIAQVLYNKCPSLRGKFAASCKKTSEPKVDDAEQKQGEHSVHFDNKKALRQLSHELNCAPEDISEQTSLMQPADNLDNLGIGERGQPQTDAHAEDGESPLSETNSDGSNSGGVGDDSGYQSNLQENPHSEIADNINNGPSPGNLNQTGQMQTMQGHSGTAVFNGASCREPHPLPSNDQSNPVMCTSSTSYVSQNLQ